MKFKSEVSLLIAIIFGVVIAILGYSLAVTLMEEENTSIQIVLISVISIVSAFLVWILLGTQYTIKENTIYWKSAFLRGTIDINSIEKIQKRTTMLSGLKPAAGLKGVIITYSKGKRIYFSPRRQNEFVRDLVNVNRKIKVEK